MGEIENRLCTGHVLLLASERGLTVPAYARFPICPCSPPAKFGFPSDKQVSRGSGVLKREQCFAIV